MGILTFNSQLQNREISTTRSKKMNDGSIYLEMRQNVCSKSTRSFCVWDFSNRITFDFRVAKNIHLVLDKLSIRKILRKPRVDSLRLIDISTEA